LSAFTLANQGLNLRISDLADAVEIVIVIAEVFDGEFGVLSTRYDGSVQIRYSEPVKLGGPKLPLFSPSLAWGLLMHHHQLL
jgi:hypothetical protein